MMRFDGKYISEGIILHDIRRSLKINVLKEGIQEDYGDTDLGHSSKGMDRHYIVPTTDDLMEAMWQYTDWLDALIKGVL